MDWVQLRLTVRVAVENSGLTESILGHDPRVRIIDLQGLAASWTSVSRHLPSVATTARRLKPVRISLQTRCSKSRNGSCVANYSGARHIAAFALVSGLAAVVHFGHCSSSCFRWNGGSTQAARGVRPLVEDRLDLVYNGYRHQPVNGLAHSRDRPSTGSHPS